MIVVYGELGVETHEQYSDSWESQPKIQNMVIFNKVWKMGKIGKISLKPRKKLEHED